MKILEVLGPRHIIVPLTVDNLRGAVLTLVQRLVETGAVVRPERLERLVSDERIRDVVHAGDRVLLPHARTDAVDKLVVALGIAANPLVSGPGREPGRERIVVLVLAPPEASSHYLQVVAALARALRDESTTTALLAARSAEDVLSIPEVRDLTVQPTLTVRDVMSTQVYRVAPETPVGEVLDLMRRHQVKAVPVVGDKHEVMGVISDGEMLKFLMPTMSRVAAGDKMAAHQAEQLFATPVREIMRRSVMCISEDQALSDVVSTMITKNVERLPVVQEGKLTGFLTRTDVMRKVFS